ncbi:ubiquitin-conjugating enzyme E2 Q2-like [Rhopilema esculentum]|uniref:ubiquitin-conjugating enzyme E2 Q2-like n=1 Tax=Rhopilema esculentum TaxID=499914 RepID=UPI0031D1469A|eukprot:gene5853-11175_t
MSQNLQGLKFEVKHIQNTFPRTHEFFRTVSATLDDLTFHFIGKNGMKHVVSCNITGIYPQPPPMWFSESEDAAVTDIIEAVNNLSTQSNRLLLAMTRYLVKELLRTINTPVPSYLENLDDESVMGELENSTTENIAENDADLNEDEGIEDQDDFELDEELEFEEDAASQESKEKDEIGAENFAVLEKIRLNHREEHLKGTFSGSVQATDRLMKELRNVYKSESFRIGSYTVELNEDSLYDWRIKLKSFDKESKLYKDLQTLKKQEATADGVLLSMTFTERFPFQPPFVRVCYPILTGGYVLTGGAICMELLTPQGWSSAYSIEAVIMQISATLVKGKARINFSDNARANMIYSLQRAQQSFKSLVQIHEKSGWFTPPKDEG